MNKRNIFKYLPIPEIWNRETGCLILGGGPSIKNLNFDLLNGYNLLGVNNSCYLSPMIKICYFGDLDWWIWNKEKLQNYKGVVFTSCGSVIFHKIGSRVIPIKRGKPTGIDQRNDQIAWNRNSGFSAINLAYHLGARKIGLLGFDMRMVDGESNFHHDHEKSKNNDDTYLRFLQVAEAIRKDADILGIEILNLTQDSALKSFPFLTMEELQWPKRISS